MAFGELGLRPTELDEFTPREFQDKVKGYFQAIERKEKAEWERTRANTLTLASCLLTKQSDLNKVNENWRFEWEKKAKDFETRFTPEELKRQLDEMDKHHLEQIKKGYGSISGIKRKDRS